MENREITHEDWPMCEQSGELGNIAVHGRNSDSMLCYYETPVNGYLHLGFVYRSKNGKERRTPILSVGSLVAHNPYWDKVPEQPPQEELRRWAALPQIKDIYSME